MVTKRQSRAQLLLITAVLIATFILGAVVLLNFLHESPEFGTQQDAMSMDESERLISNLEADLHRSFLRLSDSDPVPFAEENELKDSSLQYGERLTDVSTAYGAGITNVSYNEDRSETGDIVWVNSSANTSVTNDRLLNESDELVYLYTDADDLELDIGGQTLAIRDDTVEWQGESLCDGEELELIYKKGEIRGGSGEYCRIDISNLEEGFNVTAEDGDIGIGEALVISTTGGDVSTVSLPDVFRYQESTVVDPVFDVTYMNPEISFETTIHIFERGER